MENVFCGESVGQAIISRSVRGLVCIRFPWEMLWLDGATGAFRDIDFFRFEDTGSILDGVGETFVLVCGS